MGVKTHYFSRLGKYCMSYCVLRFFTYFDQKPNSGQMPPIYELFLFFSTNNCLLWLAKECRTDWYSLEHVLDNHVDCLVNIQRWEDCYLRSRDFGYSTTHYFHIALQPHGKFQWYLFINFKVFSTKRQYFPFL